MTVEMKAESRSSTKHDKQAARLARQPPPDAERLKELSEAGGMEGGMEEGSAGGLSQAYEMAETGGPRKRRGPSKALKG